MIEARLPKRHAIMGLSLGQIVFGFLGSIFKPFFFWALFVEIGPVGFFFLFSLNLPLVVGLFW